MICGRRKMSLVKKVILLIGMMTVYKGILFALTWDMSKLRFTMNIEDTVPVIYIITPTYTRLEQKADLTRLSQTLRLVKHLHWIVIEDSTNKTNLVTIFLQQSHVSYTHLHVKSMNVSEWRKVYSSWARMPRGVSQRNLALDWIEKNSNESYVVYFADDDNTYNVRIFEEMRYTRKVSVWPVGLVGGSKYESPVVRNGQVIGWIAGYSPNRKFALDMAGFAVNGKLLQMTKARFNTTCVFNLEPCFFAQLKLNISDLEPKADNCTKVLVWHTQTRGTSLGHDKTRQKMADKFSEKDLEV